MPRKLPAHRHLVLFALVLAGLLRLTAAAGAAPTLGFVETFPGNSVGTWGGGRLSPTPAPAAPAGFPTGTC